MKVSFTRGYLNDQVYIFNFINDLELPKELIALYHCPRNRNLIKITFM